VHLVYTALQEFGAAVEFCDKALQLDGGSRKALVRRAKANIGRHEYAAASQDIMRLKEASHPYDEEVAELERTLARTQRADQRADRQTFSGMFDRAGHKQPVAATPLLS
jgi:Tfp pilus assembly protein PilF